MVENIQRGDRQRRNQRAREGQDALAMGVRLRHRRLSCDRADARQVRADGLHSVGDSAETFSSEKTLTLNRTTLHLKHYDPAHTDSDISVNFSEADIVHVGDTYWNEIYPFIDYSTGGSIGGTIKATEENLAAVTDRTIVIPGHGNPVSNKQELISYRDMLVAVRDNVARLKQQGSSLEEAIAAKPTAAFDAKWGQFVITPALFTRLVYQGA
jgi:glyoxylase-like metal-dependent hydrolase (beta-lactamase superfamily II)